MIHQDEMALNAFNELDKYDHSFDLSKRATELYLRLNRDEEVKNRFRKPT